MRCREFEAAIWSTDPESCCSLDGAVGTSSFRARDGLFLEIPFGSLSRLDDGSAVHFGADKLKRAYGRCQSGEFITLIDLLNLSRSYNGLGFTKESWKSTVRRRCNCCDNSRAFACKYEWQGEAALRPYSHAL